LENQKTVIEIILGNIKKIESLEDIQVMSNFKYIEREIFDTIRLKTNLLKAKLDRKDYVKILNILNKARKGFFSNRKEDSNIKYEIEKYFSSKK